MGPRTACSGLGWAGLGAAGSYALGAAVCYTTSSRPAAIKRGTYTHTHTHTRTHTHTHTHRAHHVAQAPEHQGFGEDDPRCPHCLAPPGGADGCGALLPGLLRWHHPCDPDQHVERGRGVAPVPHRDPDRPQPRQGEALKLAWMMIVMTRNGLAVGTSMKTGTQFVWMFHSCAIPLYYTFQERRLHLRGRRHRPECDHRGERPDVHRGRDLQSHQGLDHKRGRELDLRGE
jgi:hypothetical protein